MKNTSILFTALMLLLFPSLSFSQSMVQPTTLTTLPNGTFAGTSQTYCMNGSGLSSFPFTVSGVPSVTHASPSDLALDGTFNGDGFLETSWTFGFSSAQDIKGVALWAPCAASNGGDGPMKKIAVFNGTTTDTFDLGTPSNAAKIFYFSSTYIGATSITFQILEAWHTNNVNTADCGQGGWSVYSSGATVNGSYNLMLGEVMFVRHDNVGVEENNIFNNISLSPNPVTKHLTIDLNYLETSLNVRVYNLLGEEVLFERFNNTTKPVVNTEYLPKGAYLIKMDNGTSVATKKIIKQ